MERKDLGREVAIGMKRIEQQRIESSSHRQVNGKRKELMIPKYLPFRVVWMLVTYSKIRITKAEEHFTFNFAHIDSEEPVKVIVDIWVLC